MATNAFSQLMALLAPIHDRAQATARRLCRSDADGDDLFQDAVLRAMGRIDSLRDEGAFGLWFHRIMLSLHRTRARRSVWRRWVSIGDIEEPIGDDGTRWEDDRWAAARARQALATLPDVMREAIVLFELDGYSIEEVAVMQEASVSAVKSRLVRGRERLARFYRRAYAQARLPSAVAADNGG